MTCRFLIFSLLLFNVALPVCAIEDAPATQNTYLFEAKDAATIITDALMKTGLSEAVKVRIEGMRDQDTLMSANEPITGDIGALDIDKAHSHWEATLLLKAGAKNLAPVKLAGRYDEMTQLPVLKHRVQAGDVISMEDIEWSAVPSEHLRKTTVTDPQDLVGKSPKRVISEGRPIRLDEIASAPIIKKGARITLVFKTPNLEIKTLGEALENGAKGDVIRVKNVTSKSIIEGTVETSNIIRITAPESTSAEAL